MPDPQWIPMDSPPPAGLIAVFDQASAAVSEALAGIVSAQVEFILARDAGDQERLQRSVAKSIERVTNLDPKIAMSLLLTFAASEASEYVEQHGGPAVMRRRLDEGRCPCGHDCQDGNFCPEDPD